MGLKARLILKRSVASKKTKILLKMNGLQVAKECCPGNLQSVEASVLRSTFSSTGEVSLDPTSASNWENKSFIRVLNCLSCTSLLTVEDVAVLQLPSIRDAVADDLVHRRAAGLGKVVVVERRWVAVPRCAGLVTVSTWQGHYKHTLAHQPPPHLLQYNQVSVLASYRCVFLPDAQRDRFLP